MEEASIIGRLTHWLAEACEAQRGRLFLWLPVWLGVGIVSYFAQTEEPPRAAPVVLCSVAAVILIASWRWPLPRVGLVPLACALIGFAASQCETARKPALADLPRRATVIEGSVRAVDLLPDGGRRLDIGGARIAGGAPLARLVRITMEPDDPVTPDVGDHVRTRALLREPDPPSSPGARDPQFEAFFSNLAGTGRALTLVEDLGGGHQSWIGQLRRSIAAEAVADLPGSPGGIAATLLAGATAAIPQADRSAFANSGLAHILAVAGLHMASVMGLVFGAVRLALVLVPRWGLILPCKSIAACAGLLAGLIYLLLTGDHVPTERSFAMAALVVLGVLTGRRVISLRGLALAALVVLLIAPDALVGVSFQMSFAAVLALIAGYRALAPLLVRMQGWQGAWGWLGRHLLLLSITSFLAGTATLPFAAAGFGQIQIYYVFANLVAVPITVVVVMPMAVAALLLMPFHAAIPALWLMGQGITAILWVARLVSGWPAAVVAWPPTPVWGLLLVALGSVMLGLMAGRARLLGLLPLALGLAAPFLATAPNFLLARDGRLVAWRDHGVARLWQAKYGAAQELADWHKIWPRVAWQPIDCNQGQCRLGQVALVTRQGSPDCNARLILAVVPLYGACSGVVTVDRFDVWRNGAYAVWWRPGQPKLLSDRGLRGSRPWVPQAPDQ